MPLPIEQSLPELRRSLTNRTRVVLRAPPGTGKTTLAPPSLLDELWLAGRKILMLEPRRLAARSAARRIAQNTGTELGKLAGYRTRTDTVVGPSTRIEVVTEGILTRMLQSDPGLEEVGLLIFDEFHERSIHADLGLALALDVQANLRDDLRLLLMSATIDEAAIAAFLGDAKIVTCESRMHPVQVTYQRRFGDERVEIVMPRIVRQAVAEERGSVLAFLPGVREILAVERALRQFPEFEDVIIAPLYGDLDKRAQDAAILPAPDGRRKIVLATSIAESSLTIEGIRIVVDSGLARKPRFNPRTGLERLETVRISKASAEQRKGRAGRLEPGVCLRLWSEEDHRSLAEKDLPEILETDLAPLALELAKWGVTDPGALRWLDPPPKSKFEQGRDVLRMLDAVEASGGITEKGTAMLGLGVHPRLASMLIESRRHGWTDLAGEVAALLGERDLVKFDAPERDVELRIRVEILRHGAEQGGAWSARRFDREGRKRVMDEAGRLARRVGGVPSRRTPVDKTGLLLAFAFPDRVALQRNGTERAYLMANGRGACFLRPEPLANEETLVVAEVDDKDRDARIFLAAPVSFKELEANFASHFATVEALEWNDRDGVVTAVKRRMFGQIILSESALSKPNPDKVVRLLADVIRRKGLAVLPWTPDAENLRARVGFLKRRGVEDGWPDMSDEALLASLEKWLGAQLKGIRRFEDFARLRLGEALAELLDWSQKEQLSRRAPDRFKLPTGTGVRLDYTEGDAPTLSARVQELFGTRSHPTVFDGKVPVVVKLLSPSMRPVQTTANLPGFWSSSYVLVKKDLKGRYPKHSWPDDPLNAEPTRRVRRT